jgi:hypothetical protein
VQALNPETDPPLSLTHLLNDLEGINVGCEYIVKEAHSETHNLLQVIPIELTCRYEARENECPEITAAI